MIIDCHVHIVPPEIREKREKWITEREKEVFLIYNDPNARMVSIESLLSVMDEQGVDMAVIFGLPWSTKELYRLNNDYVLSMAQQNPERLIPFCCVDVEAEGALKEVERCITKGARGVGELAFYSADFDESRISLLSKIASLCNEAGVPVVVHANEEIGHNYPGKSPMTLRGLYNLVKRNPDTKWILAHLGGGLPFFGFLKKNFKDVIRNCWFDTAAVPFLYRPSVYSFLIDAVGEDKLLFGTDFPLLKPQRYYREFELARLNKKVKEQILGNNFKKLLQISNHF